MAGKIQMIPVEYKVFFRRISPETLWQSGF
jgi:hypothetical protein